mmetsp:Transcript_50026/g.125675  ORF Transcript_50026/g.125675 Transcript_50026/m.125675 type:complete len:208 (-) Transcript_50026:290-913(-)
MGMLRSTSGLKGTMYASFSPKGVWLATAVMILAMRTCVRSPEAVEGDVIRPYFTGLTMAEHMKRRKKRAPRMSSHSFPGRVSVPIRMYMQSRRMGMGQAATDLDKRLKKTDTKSSTLCMFFSTDTPASTRSGLTSRGVVRHEIFFISGRSRRRRYAMPELRRYRLSTTAARESSRKQRVVLSSLLFLFRSSVEAAHLVREVARSLHS